MQLHASRASYASTWSAFAIQAGKRFLGRFLEAGKKAWEGAPEIDGQRIGEDETEMIRKKDATIPDQVWVTVVDAVKMLVEAEMGTVGTRAGNEPGHMERNHELEAVDRMLEALSGLLRRVQEGISTSYIRHHHPSVRCAELVEGLVKGWRKRRDGPASAIGGWHANNSDWDDGDAENGLEYNADVRAASQASFTSGSGLGVGSTSVGSGLHDVSSTVPTSHQATCCVSATSSPPRSYFNHPDEIHLSNQHFDPGPPTTAMDMSHPHPHSPVNATFRAQNGPALLNASGMVPWQTLPSMMPPNDPDGLEKFSMMGQGPGSQF